MLHQRFEQRMKDDALGVTFQDNLFHAVVQDLVRRPAGLFEGQHVTVADRVGVGGLREADELPAAVAEHHREAHHGGRLAAEIHGVIGEIDLSLLALVGLESQVRAAPQGAADGAHVFLQHTVTTRVSEGADLP
jgi:hypothetical protein